MRAVSLPGLWRRDAGEPRILDEEDVRTAERNKQGGAVLIIVAALAVLVSYGSNGLAGLIVSLSTVAVGVLLAAVISLPTSPARRRRRRTLPSFDQPYPTYAQMSERLSWAQVSPRHYDMVTRPLLVRLLASRLADHHGIDLYRSPEAAKALIGDDVWWWLDPDRTAEASSQPPGVDVRTLSRLVERLETL